MTVLTVIMIVSTVVAIISVIGMFVERQRVKNIEAEQAFLKELIRAWADPF